MSNPDQRISPKPGQESVWDYPRPPRPVDSAQHIQIEVEGQILADSRRTKRVLETSHPPVYYIPPDDIRMDLLRRTLGNSWCEWKGVASYYDLVVGERLISRVAWTYSNPNPGFEAIQEYIAFYPSKLERCSVDGETVRAQEGDFYGGWITSNIVGPFKGGPGTSGW